MCAEDDEVMKEIRANRAAFAAEHGNDLKRIFGALQAAEAASDREYVRRPPKKPIPIPEQNSR